jgi:Transcriptional regulator of RNA polII, SAGA, subunit
MGSGAPSERIDLQSLRAKIRAALGKDRAGPYFDLLRRYVAGELTKRELDVHATSLLGGGGGEGSASGGGDAPVPATPAAAGRLNLLAESRSDFVALHNLFIKAILHNAACAEGPPLPPNTTAAASAAPARVPSAALQPSQVAALRMMQAAPKPAAAPPQKSSRSNTKSKSSKSSKRDKKNKKGKKVKKSSSSSNAASQSGRSAAQQAAAVIAARQVHVEQQKRQQQLQQQQQQLQQQQQQQQQRAANSEMARAGAWPGLGAADERRLYGSRPELLRNRIANQTPSHAAVRQRMLSIVSEFAATTQTPGILRAWPVRFCPLCVCVCLFGVCCCRVIFFPMLDDWFWLGFFF